CRCFHQLSQSVLQLFVGSDLDRSSGLDRRHRAMAAQRAASTDFGVKLDDRTRIEVLDLACWAPDRSVPHVDLELGLRKSCAVAADPWLASDRAAASEDILDEHASDVSAIDVERSDGVAPAQLTDVVAQTGCPLFLRTVRRRECASQNEIRIEIGGEVTLVAVEAFALALPPVAHVAIFDRHAPVLGNTDPDARSAIVRIGLEILGANLPQRREVVRQRRLAQFGW